MAKRRVLKVREYNNALNRETVVSPMNMPPYTLDKNNAEALLFFLLDRVPANTLKRMLTDCEVEADRVYRSLYNRRESVLTGEREPFRQAKVHEDVITALRKHAPHLLKE
jgi:hypothetical protein